MFTNQSHMLASICTMTKPKHLHTQNRFMKRITVFRLKPNFHTNNVSSKKKTERDPFTRMKISHQIINRDILLLLTLKLYVNAHHIGTTQLVFFVRNVSAKNETRHFFAHLHHAEWTKMHIHISAICLMDAFKDVYGWTRHGLAWELSVASLLVWWGAIYRNPYPYCRWCTAGKCAGEGVLKGLTTVSVCFVLSNHLNGFEEKDLFRYSDCRKFTYIYSIKWISTCGTEQK